MNLFRVVRNKIKRNSNSLIIWFIKWGIIYSIAILLANYIIDKLMVFNLLLEVIIAAMIISIIEQVARNHNMGFNLKWFSFFFLIYANIIWLVGEYILPETIFGSALVPLIILGFVIAGVVVVIRKSKIRSNSVKWALVILILVLLVGNMESIPYLEESQLLEDYSDNSILPEDKQTCPSIVPGVMDRALSDGAFDPEDMGPALNKVVDSSVWTVENTAYTCYKGKYQGQYPEWYYCDGMIVSRWETSSSGTIDYKWYTAVTAEWSPEEDKYILDNLACENGQKVVVDKDTTSYYVYVSKDGTEIQIEY